VVTSSCRVVCTVVVMGNSGSPGYQARRREPELQPRKQAQRTPMKEAGSPKPGSSVEKQDRLPAATACGWCGEPITPRSRGPMPKWCSATCRHRAWEQARAAASGRAAVQVVERRVEVPTRLPLTRRDWPQALQELAQQLHDGRIYDRDLTGLSVALDAYNRRPYVRLRAADEHHATWGRRHPSR
jgi:hypothetical protein